MIAGQSSLLHILMVSASQSVCSEESILCICMLILFLKSKHIFYYIFSILLFAVSKAYANNGSYAYDFWYKVSKTGEESFMLELKCAHCKYMWIMPIRDLGLHSFH
jgi:hypothetical protein